MAGRAATPRISLAFAALLAVLARPAWPAQTAAPAAVDSVADALRWRLLGPFRGGWGEMVEGVARAPDTFFFAAAGGGVWRSDNAGRTWRPLFDQGPTAPVGALAVAPSDNNRLYIGTGQPEPRYDVAGGAGVFRSDDGGAHWRPLGLEKTRHIGRILVDPRNADTLLVAAVGDFFGPGPDRGVYRSTDAGRTWSRVLDVGPETGAVDLAADPAEPGHVFAAAWQARQYPWQSYFTPVQGAGSAIWESADGGVRWRRLGGAGWPSGPLGRISLATTRTARGLRLYAVVSSDKAGGLYRSDDAGASWTRVNDDPAFTGYYANRVTVAPDDPDVVWLVGQSLRRCGEGGRMCEIFKGAPGGDDYHQVWINPERPDHMATASDQGVVVSVDGGRTWSSWYNQPTGQFYHLETDRQTPYRIYSGQQDSGTVSIASRSDYGALTTREWNPVGGEERDYDIPDPEDPGIVYASGLGGRVTRWDARTGQSANIAPFLEPNYGKRQTETAHHFVWVTPLAVSLVGPPILYLGGEVVFASSDRGAHWRVISPDLTGKTAAAAGCDGEVRVADAKACGYGGIWSLAPSPREAGEVWVGTDDGLMQLTRDGGGHWRNVTPPGLAEWAKVASIDVSRRDAGRAWIAVDNHRQSDLAPYAFETRDYGATWRSISGDLPGGHFVSVVRADPERDGLLYAGTDVGVFFSLDDGAHWRPLRSGLPTAWIRDLHIHGADLIAATQGRALWVLDDIAPLRQVRMADAPVMRLFDPPDTLRLRANNNRDTPAPPEESAGANPPPGAILDYWLPAPAKGEVRIDIRDTSGALVRTLSSIPNPPPPAERYFAQSWIRPAPPLPTAAGAHRAVWDLRFERPAAIAYAYSLSTAAGSDTPITPQGPLALPGVYRVSLVADGRRVETTLRLLPDPRSTATGSDLAASLALSREIGESLALARRGYGEMAAVHQQLGLARAVLAKRDTPAAVRQSVDALLKRTEAGDEDAGFAGASRILAGIETDLEGADLAPTDAQQATARAQEAVVSRLWADWSGLRDGDLRALSATLAAAGAAPVVIPPSDRLRVPAPEEHEDLP